MTLTLSTYKYSICYRQGKMLSNTDALSCLPRSITTSSDCVPGDLVHLIHHLSTMTTNGDKIKNGLEGTPFYQRFIAIYPVGGQIR